MTCCREPGQILIVPSEGGYSRFLEESPAELTYGDVVSSMEDLLEGDGGEQEEQLFDLNAADRVSRPFVVEVPEEQLKRRVELLRGDRRLAAAVPNWHVSLRGTGATAEEADAFVRRARLAPVSPWARHGGRLVRVAVLDSGVADDAVCCTALEPVQLDTTGGPNGLRSTPGDTEGHGSTVARIIHHVMPEARIVSIRCFSNNRARLSDVIYGLTLGRVLRESPDIYNMSFSVDAGVELCPHCRRPLFAIDQHRALQQLFEHLRTQLDDRPLLVAAAGNQRGPVAIPAALDGVLGVGSTGDGSTTDPCPAYTDDVPTEFVLAPGGSASLPVSAGDGRHPRPVFGTSFATALVTGFLATIVTHADRLGLSDERDALRRSDAINTLAMLAYTGFSGYDPRRHGLGVIGRR